jgi:uncharacterized membrane protein
MSIYLRAALLGLATGGRSTIGITALALTTPRTGSWLTNRWVGRTAALASGVELVGDQLPQAPSRFAPPGLISRLVGGVVSGALLARRSGRPGSMVPAALIGLLAAILGAVLGSRWRSLAARRFGTDWPGAVLEDVVWLGLAGYAVAPR